MCLKFSDMYKLFGLAEMSALKVIANNLITMVNVISEIIEATIN